MYKAVFIDIDGTLIKSDHSLSQATKDAIKCVKEKGVQVVLVSARPLHGITAISRELGLADVPIASLNGSYIALDDKILFNSSIDLKTLSNLHQDLKNYNVSIIYYQQMQWFAESTNLYTTNEQKITTIPIQINTFENLNKEWIANSSGPNKLLVIGEASEIEKVQMNLSSNYTNDLNMCTSKPIYLEVMNKSSSKKCAIEYFLKYYNIKRDEVIAIGDNYNDIEMIQFAGLGIAMGNAPEAVKSCANIVTKTNNENGVCSILNLIFKY